MNARLKSIVCLVLIFLLGEQLYAQLPLPEGRRLRDIVSDNFPEGKLLIGATTGSWGIGEPIGEIMDREFSYVTPENDFKQSVVRANPTEWNWSRADAWLQHIVDNDQVLRIHGPISPQCSNWAKDDSRTAEELSQELDTFMTALCKRYNGVEGIEYLDVVNEIALDDGRWHHPKPGTDQWENPWLIIGQDDDPNKTPLYVTQAFAIANEHAPDLKQIINNHCHPGTKGMEKVKETILYLRDKGYRVDGLGWQAHVEVGWATEENLQHLRDVIDWCQERNLEFHVTEFDAWIMNRYTQTFEQQAYTYKAIMDVLLEKLDSLTIGWNTWHITDASGWKTERLPSLFDDKYHAKPAYYAMQLALETKGDYSAKHNVTFQVKNEESGEFVDTFQCRFNNVSLDADAVGQAVYTEVSPARYSVQVMKNHFNTLVKKNVIIHSDTLITLFIKPASYTVHFSVKEKHTGNIASSIHVILDTLKQQTGLDGIASFSLKPGQYQVELSGTGYKSLNTEVSIASDTTITISLEKTHGDLKFRLKKNTQPVKDALIILENDSVYTNSVGIGTFSFLPLNSNYSFRVEKEGFEPENGSITLNRDTTVELALTSLFANITFQVVSDLLFYQNAFISIAEDTVSLTNDLFARFYAYHVDSSYTYNLHYNSNIVKTGMFYLENDTNIQVAYNPTNSRFQVHRSEVQLFPNPVSNRLHIGSVQDIESVELLHVNGRTIRKLNNAGMRNITMNVTDVPVGYYILNLKMRGSNIILNYPIIIE